MPPPNAIADAAPPGLAILGGSFNPPHLAHRRLATAARQLLPVQRVLVLPTGDHPHKRGQLAPASHRLAMCRLAFADLPDVVVDDRELHRPGPSYTVDTLAELAAEQPGRRLYLVLGSDNLPLLPTWHDHHRLLGLATVVTYPRAGHPVDAAQLASLDLSAAERHALLAQVLPMPPVAIDDTSATAIRAAVRAGKLGELPLPAGVAAYIATHGLYDDG